jgi:C4-dicarboxylate transporter, DctM subunit
MASPMNAIFQQIERIVGAVDRGVGAGWRRFSDGPLQNFLFVLILFISGCIALLKGVLSEANRMWANVEKALIGVAMLAMTALSFMDYMRREASFFTLEIQGGPNMAVVLMVWVGFLGASLAAMERKHLAVDATERLLSGRAARLAKRFSALAAAGFCWSFSDYAIELVDESLTAGSGQDALPLWDWLVGPINVLGSAILGETGIGLGLTALAAIGFLGSTLVLRRWRRMDPPEPPEDDDKNKPLEPIVWERASLSFVGSVSLFLLALAMLGSWWSPTHEDGSTHVWSELQTSAEQVDLSTEDVDALDAELDALLGIDDGPSVEQLQQETAAGQKFPLWLAQAVIPLSFLIMAFRFLGLALSGTFEETYELAEPAADGQAIELERPNKRGARDLLIAGLFPGILLGLVATLGMETPTLIFMGAILLILVGAPLFLTVGVASVACVTLIQDISGYIVAKDMYEAVKKEELLAIPFFVLAGNIMTQGSIADRLVGLARAVMGKTPGGLGIATIVACVIFAAISGSSPVTVIAVGSIMFPMLVEERYPEDYSLGVLTSAGSLGIIIPPSVPMIIFAIMVSSHENQVSPNDLFIAGILPGLFIATVLVLYTMYQTRPTRPGNEIKPVTYDGTYGSNLRGQLWRSVWSLMLPVMILGGIYGVLGPLKFTVTEAAAVAVVYALFVELVVHREMPIRKLPKILADSGVMMGSLFLIIVLAIAFNKFLSEQMIPQQAAEWLQTVVSSKWQFLILCNLFLLALGCVMEIISAILIVAPLLAPIAMQYGMDPIHFGIMFIVNLELGYLTPPMGVNLFVSSTVFNRDIIQVIKATAPFLVMMLFCLAVIAWFEDLSLFLLR